MTPTVSVVIPAFNSARFVCAAIDSVLRQTFKDIEVLLVDDGSTDETGKLMREYGPPVRYLRQEKNTGVAVARNRGIAESSGRLIAFLDADDLWSEQMLERQLRTLARAKTCRAVYSAFTIVGPDLEPLAVRRSRRRGSLLEDLLLQGNIVGSICGVLCEQSAMQEAGGFDSGLSQAADWDMWIRLAALTDFAYCDEPLVLYRRHSGNMSRDVSLLESDSCRVLEKAFAMPALPPSLRARQREAIAHNYMVLAGSYLHAGRVRDFARCFARAVTLDAAQWRYVLAFPLRLARRSGSALLGFPDSALDEHRTVSFK